MNRLKKARKSIDLEQLDQRRGTLSHDHEPRDLVGIIAKFWRTRTPSQTRLSIAILCALIYVLWGFVKPEEEYYRRDATFGPTHSQSFAGSRAAKNSQPPASKHVHCPHGDNDITKGSHEFLPNGHLLVNPTGPHPIHTLIEHAEAKWENLLAKQSKTLEESVAEYKRRYRRNPPKGYDKWWNYAVKHNVVLKDEYDRIMEDIEPFYALDPRDLHHRANMMQLRDNTFTVAVMNNEVSTHGPPSAPEAADLLRATDIADIIDRFAEDLPGDVNITILTGDNPAVLLAHVERERLLELAAEGEYFGPSEFMPSTLGTNSSNFVKACPDNSALARDDWKETYPNQQTFIYNHVAAMDICEHPEFYPLHGHTQTGGYPLSPIAPIFTWAKTSLYGDILVTPLEQYDDDYLVYDPPFKDKTRNKLFWRGSTTGSEFRMGYPWKESQRSRLHFLASNNSAKHTVAITSVDPSGKLQRRHVSLATANKKYMDVSFAGKPEQCDPATCAEMDEAIKFGTPVGLVEANEYKFTMDVDGNGWSGRFHRLMTGNAAALKSTLFPEWYRDMIVPWVHYIPVKIDYSDLYDIMSFFAGDMDGKNAHQELAEKIGTAGHEFAGKLWRREDMASYMFRVLLEYWRLLNIDGDVHFTL